MFSCILTPSVAPTTAPRNVTIKRFVDGIFVSWNELSVSESRGNPIYVVEYQSTMSGSSVQTVRTSEMYAVIENLSSDETYTVSVAAAVSASGNLMVGPSSSSIMAPSSGKCNCYNSSRKPLTQICINFRENKSIVGSVFLKKPYSIFVGYMQIILFFLV